MLPRHMRVEARAVGRRPNVVLIGTLQVVTNPFFHQLMSLVIPDKVTEP